MNRAKLLRAVDRRLGNRRLVWAGLRADDVHSLVDLPQLESSFSILALSGNSEQKLGGLSYEDLSKRRVDLEAWDIQEHLESSETATFRRALLSELAPPSALLPYRPSEFLSAVGFARQDTCLNLGLFGGHQAAFEHKPWVETSVASLGLAQVPWIYVSDEERNRVKSMLRGGPVLVRASRTSGGEGLHLVRDSAELDRSWISGTESFLSVAPFLQDVVPVNIGATVWEDGVTIHHPSVQLVGLPSCVVRPFGYCGNDFARAGSLDPNTLDAIERGTLTIGDWLRRQGYRGSFGIDFLVTEGRVLFTEINPRFQGSTHASARLSVEQGEACLYLEHLAARLGIDMPVARSIHDLVSGISPLAHIVVHSTRRDPAHIDPSGLVENASAVSNTSDVDVLTNAANMTDPSAVVARITVREAVTSTGFDLCERWLKPIEQWHASLDSQPTA